MKNTPMIIIILNEKPCFKMGNLEKMALTKTFGQSEALAEAKNNLRNTIVDEKHTYNYNYTR